MDAATVTLAEKLHGLSDEQITEVEEFVDSVRLRAQDGARVKAGLTLSAPSFQAIWDNDEDAAYDAL